MPFRYEEKTTPKGAPLLVVHASGHVSFADAEELGNRLVVASSEPHRCRHGMLRLTWKRENERGERGSACVHAPKIDNRSVKRSSVSLPVL